MKNNNYEIRVKSDATFKYLAKYIDMPMFMQADGEMYCPYHMVINDYLLSQFKQFNVDVKSGKLDWLNNNVENETLQLSDNLASIKLEDFQLISLIKTF